MNSVVIFNKETGHIIRTGYGFTVESLGPDEDMIDGFGMADTYYVKNRKLVPLKHMDLQIEGLSIKGLPKKSKIQFHGQEFTPTTKWSAPSAGVAIISSPQYKTVVVELKDYVGQRAAEYPEIGSQLDAIYKGFVALKEQRVEIPLATEEWMNQIAAVKEAYTKTE